MNTKPAALTPGDTIGVMAPSSYVERKDIERATTLMEERGYKVHVHPQTYERHNQSAGTSAQKLAALHELWADDTIKAIWAAGGGNRALHILDEIDFKLIAQTPKILIGFSDTTALLNGIYAHSGLITFHGPVFKNLHKHAEIDHTLALLGGKTSSIPLNDAQILNHGQADGPLIGGNLSLFQYLPKTLPNDFYKGALLFLEDCSEELSRIDRMVLHLKRLGVFSQISGLLFGEFTDTNETGRTFGFTLEDIIKEHTERLNIPVVMNAPFGHGAQLYTMPIGGKFTLNTKDMSLSPKEPAAI